MRDKDEVTPMHYKLLSGYKDRQYKNILTLNNIKSKKVHINKVTFPGGIVHKEYDFWGYKLEADDKNYLLSCVDENMKEVKVKDLLPIYPEDTETLAVEGVAYEEIHKPVPARIPVIKKHEFRELVDRLNESKTNNPINKLLLTIFTLVQRMKRNNGIICSPPAMGKDSTLAIIDYLFGGCGAVSNPSVAKLEYLTHMKLLVINEVSSIGKAQWGEIQSFLLDVGDMKLKTQKRTRGFSGVGEIINLEDLSIALYFNDITEYGDMKKFFDFKADGNVKDRFVPIRLWSKHTENFNLITKVNIKRYVNDHYDYYRDMACTFAYYEKHLDTMFPPEDDVRFKDLPERWGNSLMVYFQGLKAYSKDEDEYNMLKDAVFRGMDDYQEMLNFPNNYEVLAAKMRLPKYVYENNCNVDNAIKFLRTISEDKNKHEKLRDVASKKIKYLKALVNEPTFKTRNLLCMVYDDSAYCKEVDV